MRQGHCGGLVMGWWHALEGFKKYAAAIASGDVADIETQRARVGECAVCKPSMTKCRATEILSLTIIPALVSCGRLGQDPEPGKCGCLLMRACEPQEAHVTIDGVPLKACGKPEVGSEKCPSGKW